MKSSILPHNIEAERKTLAAMMRDKTAVVKVQNILTSDDFYTPAHRKIFSVILDLSVKGIYDDLTSLSDELTRRGELEEIGGAVSLMEIAGSVITAVSVDYHTAIVREKAIRRRAIRNAHQQAQEAVSGDLDALASKAYQDALAIVPASKSSGFRRIDTFLDRTIETVQERMRRRSSGKPHKDIATGITDFDRYYGGFNRQELIILAARPSEGKSALAAQITLNVAERGNVAFVSCEMSGEEILGRTLGNQKGANDAETAKAVLRRASGLQQLNLFFDDSPGIRIDQLAARCERLKIEIGKLDLLVIDYLQLLHATPDMNRFPRIEKITFLSGECKALARRLDCPILLLSQLNRSCEHENRPPRLSDLRDSGSIEQDADIVAFIHRPEGIERGHSGARELLIEKNRNGITGMIRFVFDADSLVFRGLSDRDAPGEVPNW